MSEMEIYYDLEEVLVLVETGVIGKLSSLHDSIHSFCVISSSNEIIDEGSFFIDVMYKHMYSDSWCEYMGIRFVRKATQEEHDKFWLKRYKYTDNKRTNNECRRWKP